MWLRHAFLLVGLRTTFGVFFSFFLLSLRSSQFLGSQRTATTLSSSGFPPSSSSFNQSTLIMSKSTLDTDYVTQLKSIELDLTNKLTKEVPLKVFKITKNDSIKNKVEAILKFLDNDETILLSSLSNGIAKLIAITEIVKLKQPHLYQYNNLLKLESTTNPNYKIKKDNKNDDNDQIPEEGSLKKQVLEEINGPKVYTLPVMYILLTRRGSIENIDLMSWTKQKN